MGQIVGGFATSHVLFSPQGVEQQAERVVSGMMRIRQQVRALAPDVIVVVSSDHLNNFTLKQQVTLAVGVSDQFVPLGDMGIPQTPIRGHRLFAEAFASRAAHEGFDLVQAEEVRPDHGIMLTKLIVDPDSAVPTVPVFINTAMPLPPAPWRSFALGAVLSSVVRELRPAQERVVVVAGGGLSHWLRVPGQGRVAENFDRYCLAEITAGRAEELAKLGNERLLEQSGNGGLELGAWLFMAGAMPQGARGEVIYYEPVAAWGSGMGGLSLHVEARA